VRGDSTKVSGIFLLLKIGTRDERGREIKNHDAERD